MPMSMLIPALIGVGVIVVVALVVLGSKSTGEVAEDRLDQVSGRKARPSSRSEPAADALLKVQPMDLDRPSFWTRIVPKIVDVSKLYEQADVNLPFEKFMMIVVGLAVGGAAIGLVLKIPTPAIPVASAVLGLMPFHWLKRRKAARIRKFVEAMPEAVELMSRALRAGHGLASGMNLVAEEMSGPIAQEFGRVFYEQNLGMPIEVSLRAMADRIQSMDVRFFVTAIVIQRGTGGDLAEVLEKIGRLIRQRYELFGHVRSLTAEGRLSGIVLLALPPGLLGFLSLSNYKYVEPLFTSPAGTKMLVITVVLQVIGALCIKKIVAIKV